MFRKNPKRWKTKSPEEIEARIKEIVADKLGVNMDEVVPGADFVADLSVDSLDKVELVKMLEDEFGITVADEDLPKIRTVQQAIDCVKANINQG